MKGEETYKTRFREEGTGHIYTHLRIDQLLHISNHLSSFQLIMP